MIYPRNAFSSNVRQTIRDPDYSIQPKIYPREAKTACLVLDNSSSNRFRAYRDAWLPAILPDAAAFEQYLSNFTLHLQQLAPSKSSELDMIKLKLHSNSLQSINRRISSPNVATDEGLIAAVISFVAYYVCPCLNPIPSDN